MTLCPDCGEEMGDFAPCACALDAARSHVPPAGVSLETRLQTAKTYNGGMRRMVARNPP